jgi:hypothetical protein
MGARQGASLSDAGMRHICVPDWPAPPRTAALTHGLDGYVLGYAERCRRESNTVAGRRDSFVAEAIASSLGAGVIPLRREQKWAPAE